MDPNITSAVDIEAATGTSTTTVAIARTLTIAETSIKVSEIIIITAGIINIVNNTIGITNITTKDREPNRTNNLVELRNYSN